MSSYIEVRNVSKSFTVVCRQRGRGPGGAGSPAAQYILAGAGLAGPDRAGTAGGDRT